LQTVTVFASYLSTFRARRLLAFIFLMCGNQEWLESKRSLRTFTELERGIGLLPKRRGGNRVLSFLFSKMIILDLRGEMRKPNWDTHKRMASLVFCRSL